MESAPDAMIIIDHFGKITVVNEQTEKMFGYTTREVSKMVSQGKESQAVEEIINRYRMYPRLVDRSPETRIDQFPVGIPEPNRLDISAMPDLARPPSPK